MLKINPEIKINNLASPIAMGEFVTPSKLNTIEGER